MMIDVHRVIPDFVAQGGCPNGKVQVLVTQLKMN